MPRGPRIFIPDISVHVIQRGNNRCAIVADDTDRDVFTTFLRRASIRHGLSVHGYALMDTHYHLVVTPPNARSLPETIKELGVRYVQYFNRRHERVGTLWSARYRALLLSDERYWLTCLRYIEQNPVRARMVRSPEAHRWSSYAVHGKGATSDLLTPHHIYLELGSTPEERQAAYRGICGTPLDEAEIAQQRHGLGPTGVRPGSVPGLTPAPAVAHLTPSVAAAAPARSLEGVSTSPPGSRS